MKRKYPCVKIIVLRLCGTWRSSVKFSLRVLWQLLIIKLKFNIEQTMKAQRLCSGITPHFM